MKSVQYMVAYKDHPAAPTKFFAPFVTESAAEFFKASLPKPLKKGWAKIVPLQPYTAQEGHTVAQSIKRARQSNH